MVCLGISGCSQNQNAVKLELRLGFHKSTPVTFLENGSVPTFSNTMMGLRNRLEEVRIVHPEQFWTAIFLARLSPKLGLFKIVRLSSQVIRHTNF
ncbi:hypothetical protein VI817_001813 [Penicillium citrinum]|nr:hypothetical protein VI817_001813 [Penicillium citrinum]